MNWFDVVLVIIIAASALAGLRTGFARVVIGLAATIAGLLAGFWCYRIVGAKIAPYVSTEALADILGFLIIFFGVVIAGALLATLLARLFRWVGLSWFDHLLGGVAGFARGVLMVAALAAVLVAFIPSPTPAFLTQSRLLPYATEMAAALAQMAPKDLKDTFLQQWENLKQFWDHRQRGSERAA
ncbi:MAG TPA: CvpA family protein [Bryobacteraceae bacterium]|jgi:membrane protein required for colicin V production|nr:CvpA family protein [Bryobacteraceae bacterium]